MATKLAIEQEAIRNGYEVLDLRLAGEEPQNQKVNLKVANNWNGHKIAAFSVLTASTVLAASVAIVAVVFNAHLLAIAAAAAFALFAVSTILAGRATISKDLREFIDKLSNRIKELYQTATTNEQQNQEALELDRKEKERQLKEKENELQAKENALKELEEKMAGQEVVQDKPLEDLEKDVSLVDKRVLDTQQEVDELKQKLDQQDKELEALRKNSEQAKTDGALLQQKDNENKELKLKVALLQKQIVDAKAERSQKGNTVRLKQLQQEVDQSKQEIQKGKQEIEKEKEAADKLKKALDDANKLRKELEDAKKKPVPPPVPSRQTKNVSNPPAANQTPENEVSKLKMELSQKEANFARLMNEKDEKFKEILQAEKEKLSKERDEEFQIILKRETDKVHQKWEEWDIANTEGLNNEIEKLKAQIEKQPQKSQIVRNTLNDIRDSIFKTLKLDVLDENPDPKKKNKIRDVKLRAINVKNEIERLVNETLKKEFTAVAPAPEVVPAVEPESTPAQAPIEQEAQVV